jgi:glycosyltransferase involved in cell wall biosynthesis
MRILFLTTIVPAGPPAGGTLVTMELGRRLEAYGEVERWAVWTYEPGAPENGLWQGAEPVTLPGLRRHGIARALRRRQPLSVARFFRSELARQLAAHEAVDLLVTDHLGVWQYARLIEARRRVVLAHNVESELYRRAVSLEEPSLKRLAWRYEARAMARYEAAALHEPDAVVCLGSRDQRSLADLYGVVAEAWYPPVAEVRPVRAKRARGLTVGAVGSMTWQPNRWGMDWFVREAWPLVRRQMPEARLRIAGRGSERLPYAGFGGVECLGPLHDPDEFYESLDLVTAPVRGGAGIKVKVLDAAARGLPVVTTPKGFEGLGEILPPGIAIEEEDGARFADRTVALMRARQQLPMRGNVEWYHSLVASGAAAVERAVLGPAGPTAPVLRETPTRR